jgi:selenocysteine lyase/cysteine desulfurase
MAAGKSLQPGMQALLPVVGRDLQVPVAGGGEVRYANLDYAASAPALESVARAVSAALPLYASVHRGAGFASQASTAAYEAARTTVTEFVGARPGDTAIFTRNTTDALNLLASVAPVGRGTGSTAGSIVLDIEHHANLLPWLERGARIVRAGRSVAELLESLERELRRAPTALVAVTGASNVTGECLPLRRFAELAHRHGARLAVDGAQLVPHRRVDLAADGVDYLAFSGHKLYAPFGAGVLVGRADWLDSGRPYLQGGGAVSQVTLAGAEWHDGPARHEAGSPNVIGAIAIAAAIDELCTLDPATWAAHESALRDRLVQGLGAIPGVTVHRIFTDSTDTAATDAVGVVSFTVAGIKSRRAAIALSAERGIGVRDGKFCAHPLLERFGGPAIRASVGVGSVLADVERLLHAVADLAENPGRPPKYDLTGDRWCVRAE